MSTNKQCLEYLSKNFAGQDFTIDDLKNDEYIQGLVHEEKLSQNLEEKNYFLKQLNAMNELNDELEQKKVELENEQKEMMDEFKELSGKDWTSTKYIVNQPLPVDYSEMDKREHYHQQRFEQRLGITLTMINSGSGDNTLSEKNMNKSIENFLKLQNKISETFSK